MSPELVSAKRSSYQSEQNTDGCVWLASYDFLLVFCTL